MNSASNYKVIESSIAECIQKALVELSAEYNPSRQELEALLEKPKSSDHGDLAFPCFSLAKQLRSSPQSIASKLESLILPCVAEVRCVAAVQALGPFLNFRISVPFLAQEIIQGVADGSFLANCEAQTERVMIEYSQPNTHKAVHVGHLRCAFLGDTLRRLKEWQGYTTIPVNYLGDEGTHVARCLWYLRKHFKGTIPESNRGEFLGTLYTQATQLFDLSELSDVPLMGVRSAKVVSVEQHPTNAEWVVVQLDLGGEGCTVVTAVKAVTVGSIVAWAAPGTKIAGRAVGIVDKQGVESRGMVCAPDELGLGQERNILLELPSETELGKELADIFSKDPTVEPTRLIKQREQEVSKVLQAIESQKGEIYEQWKQTKQWSLDEFYEIYAWLDCKFDKFFFESECGELGKKLTREFLAKGIFEESDGAIGANLRDDGLGFCILIKSDGTATYACRDLALAQIKFEQFGVDRSLYVVDAAQSLHFKQVFTCLRKMGYEQAEKCVHFDYALVVKPEGKMSSRKGNVVLFSQLREMLDQQIYAEFLDHYKGQWSDSEISQAAHVIALATMRYGMLKQDNNSLIVFDLKEWAARSGNTGPYLLYVYARICSILREANFVTEIDFGLLQHPSEGALLVHLRDYHSVLQRAAEHCSPHFLATFLYDACKLFNAFYRDCSVLKAETAELGASRAALIEAVAQVLKHGLGLLGIPVLEKM